MLRLWLPVLLSLIGFSRASDISILSPSGELSEMPCFSPHNLTIDNKRIIFTDPRFGLKSERIDRLTGDTLPVYLSYLDLRQRSKLSSLLQRASLNITSKTGEILVVTGKNKYCSEVRLVVLVNGNFNRLSKGIDNLPREKFYLHYTGQTSQEELTFSTDCPCQEYGFNGLYGTEICHQGKKGILGWDIVNFLLSVMY